MDKKNGKSGGKTAANGALPRESAFFGRRKGRPLRQKQNSLFAEWLPQLEIDTGSKAPANLAALFAPRQAGADAPPAPAHKIENVRLEIGFGGAEHLLHEAARCPSSGFIGVEPFVNGMAKMLAALKQEPRRTANIRLYSEDALQVLDWLPDSSLAGIDIFYPDPWPKKKHWKRRFVNADNLRRFSRIMQKGGVLRFASDIDTYTNQVLQLMRCREDFVWQAADKRDWQMPYPGWPGTRYEAKAKREGRAAAYLTFLKR